MPNPPPGFVTRITPERFGGVGPWTPHTADERTPLAEANSEQLTAVGAD
jgi:hypothetical protein